MRPTVVGLLYFQYGTDIGRHGDEALPSSAVWVDVGKRGRALHPREKNLSLRRCYERINERASEWLTNARKKDRGGG